jgi:hypothetical protein
MMVFAWTPSLAISTSVSEAAIVGFSIRADCSGSRLTKVKVTKADGQRFRCGSSQLARTLWSSYVPTRSMGKTHTAPFSEGLDHFAPGIECELWLAKQHWEQGWWMHQWWCKPLNWFQSAEDDWMDTSTRTRQQTSQQKAPTQASGVEMAKAYGRTPHRLHEKRISSV